MLLLTLAYRTLTWARLRDACLGTVQTTSMIFLVLISAKVMAIALAYYGVPSLMPDFARALGSPLALLVTISVA